MQFQIFKINTIFKLEKILNFLFKKKKKKKECVIITLVNIRYFHIIPLVRFIDVEFNVN